MRPLFVPATRQNSTIDTPSTNTSAQHPASNLRKQTTFPLGLRSPFPVAQPELISWSTAVHRLSTAMATPGATQYPTCLVDRTCVFCAMVQVLQCAFRSPPGLLRQVR